MENESLNTAIVVGVALIATGLWLRRRFGSVRDLWPALMARVPVSPQSVLTALFVATAVLWGAVWVFSTPDQRAEWKSLFYENSPWAPVMDKAPPKD